MVDKAKIEKEAKGLLDKFARALEKVDTKEEEFFVEREEFERSEVNSEGCEGFKESLLANAPKKDEDFVIAEKGEWK